MRKRSTRLLGVLGAVALTTSAVGTASAASSSTNLPNGASLSVGISDPVSGDTFLIQPPNTSIDVPITGDAAVGTGVPNALWVYVIDVSGSTANPCGPDDILACEKQAATNLNAAVVADGSASEVGVGVFGEGGAAADMHPAAGDQLTSAPNDPDVNTVINSVVIGGVGQFTGKTVGSNGTNYTAGLTAASAVVAATTATNVNVVFMSDGFSNTGGAGFAAALGSLAGTGAKIFPFAVGTGANCAGGTQGTLNDIAAASGTTCTDVPDPTNLPDIVANLTATELTSVGLTVDGANTALDTIAPALPQAGPVTANWTATAADQVPGTHETCATAGGVGPANDPNATGTVTDCETYDVFAFNLQPPTATNELGTDNTHTVTATVVGAPGKLAGWPVSFGVTGQNTGATGTCNPVSCATDAAGNVTFTYTVPKAPTSLGTDSIKATVNINGDTATLQVAKKWQDTTPPVTQCVASVNPAGTIPAAPGHGGQAQNPDGFYQLLATDDIWPAVSLNTFVVDTGTGTVFGPFPVGTDIKYTEANGAQPSQKPGSGQVEWNLKGQGDAAVYAVDGSGNHSSSVSCLVPQPPK